MRIAVPIWEDRISPVLDTASRLLIVEMEDKKETSRFEKANRKSYGEQVGEGLL